MFTKHIYTHPRKNILWREGPGEGGDGKKGISESKEQEKEKAKKWGLEVTSRIFPDVLPVGKTPEILLKEEIAKLSGIDIKKDPYSVIIAQIRRFMGDIFDDGKKQYKVDAKKVVRNLQDSLKTEYMKKLDEFKKKHPIDIFKKEMLDFCLSKSKMAAGIHAYPEGMFFGLREAKNELNKFNREDIKPYLAIIETLERVVRKTEFQDTIGVTDEIIDGTRVLGNNLLASLNIGDFRKRELGKDKLLLELNNGLEKAKKTGEVQFIEIGISRENTETYQVYSPSSLRDQAISNPEGLNRKAIHALFSLPNWKEVLGEGKQGIAIYLARNPRSKILTELPNEKQVEIKSYFEGIYNSILGLDIFRKEYDSNLLNEFRKKFPGINESDFNQVIVTGKIDPMKLLNLRGIPSNTPSEALGSLNKIKGVLEEFRSISRYEKTKRLQEIESSGLYKVSDIMRKYTITDTSSIQGSRLIETLTEKEWMQMLVKLKAKGVKESDPLMMYIQSQYKYQRINSDIGTIRATQTTIRQGGISSLRQVKSGDAQTLALIDSASRVFSESEEIKDQSQVIGKYYNEILSTYGLTYSDLENPAIVENLYRKISGKTSITDKEKEFLEVLRGIRETHHIRTRSIVDVSQNMPDTHSTVKFLNDVTESKVFSEKSIHAYTTLEKGYSGQSEKDFSLTPIENTVALMEPGKIYTLKNGEIPNGDIAGASAPSLSGYSFSTENGETVKIIDPSQKTLVTNLSARFIPDFLEQVQLMRMCGLDCMLTNIEELNKVSTIGSNKVNSTSSDFTPTEMKLFLEKMFELVFNEKPASINTYDLIQEFRGRNPNKENPASGIKTKLFEGGFINDIGQLNMGAIWDSRKK